MIKSSDLPSLLRGAKPARKRKPLECRVKIHFALISTKFVIDGMKLVSEANAHEHWRKRQKRAKEQRQIVAFHMMRTIFPQLPLTCRIIRIGPRMLDSDNAWGSAKHVRDQIAEMFGVDDRDETKIKWDVTQEKGEYGVRVELSRSGGDYFSDGFLVDAT